MLTLAGNFGFERRDDAGSIMRAERMMTPALRGAERGVIAAGFSRRTQIEHTSGRRAIPLAEVLAPRRQA